MAQLFRKRSFGGATYHLPAEVTQAQSAIVLQRWREPGIKLALWRRSWDQADVRQLDALPIEALPNVHFTARLDAVRASIEAALPGARACDATLPGVIAYDIESLAACFAHATGARAIEVRLQALQDDACRLFHLDRMRARMVTTYIGPGTEWVPERYARDAIRSQDDYAGPIYAMPRFAVGLFAGSLLPNGGLVHRSPRLSNTGRFRLFLSLNEARKAK